MLSWAGGAAKKVTGAVGDLFLPREAVKRMLGGMVSVALAAHELNALTNVSVGAEFHMGPMVFTVSADVDPAIASMPQESPQQKEA